MGKIQTRKSLSVRGRTYVRLFAWCQSHGISISEYIEKRIEEHLGKETGYLARPTPIKKVTPTISLEHRLELLAATGQPLAPLTRATKGTHSTGKAPGYNSMTQEERRRYIAETGAVARARRDAGAGRTAVIAPAVEYQRQEKERQPKAHRVVGAEPRPAATVVAKRGAGNVRGDF